MQHSNPHVRPIPSSDAVFARIARQLAPGVTSAAELEARLRGAFPRTVVRRRELADEPYILYAYRLYAYRDGRFQPDGEERWWEIPDTPTAVIDPTSGEIVAAHGAWDALLRREPGDLTGRLYVEVVAPRAAEVARVLLDAVEELGEVDSETVLRHADGQDVALEVHAARGGATLHIACRPLR